MENEKKNSKSKNIVIILLIFIILGLSGYITYDKIIKKEENVKNIQAEKESAEPKEIKENVLTNEQAIEEGKKLYPIVRNMYFGQIKLSENDKDNSKLIDGNTEYKISDDGTATITKQGDIGHSKFNSKVNDKINKTFTKTGLERFLMDQKNNNKNWIIRDKDENFYINGYLSHSGTITIDDFNIKPIDIQSNEISFVVSDYHFLHGLPDSEYNVNSSKATKIDNIFTIKKENNEWKVDDYTDSYNTYLDHLG